MSLKTHSLHHKNSVESLRETKDALIEVQFTLIGIAYVGFLAPSVAFSGVQFILHYASAILYALVNGLCLAFGNDFV